MQGVGDKFLARAGFAGNEYCGFARSGLADELMNETHGAAGAHQRQSRNGPYWRLEFRDASGGISGKIWSPQSQAYLDLAPGLAVWVKGRVTSYRDKLELAVENLRIL